MTTWKTLVMGMVGALAIAASGCEKAATTTTTTDTAATTGTDAGTTTGTDAGTTTGTDLGTTTGTDLGTTGTDLGTTGTDLGTTGTDLGTTGTDLGTTGTDLGTTGTDLGTTTGDTTTNTGACQNVDDQAALKTAGSEAAAKGKECALSGKLGDALVKCVVDDLTTKHPKMTTDCAGCLGAQIGCAVKNCLVACLGTDAACYQCRNEKGCVDAFATCSGDAKEAPPK